MNFSFCVEKEPLYALAYTTGLLDSNLNVDTLVIDIYIYYESEVKLMNELNVQFNLDSPQKKFKEIIINVNKHLDEKLLYKYMIGSNGRWRTLKNYTVSPKAIWIPREDGNYIIMIQAKKLDSNKPFDYIYKYQYSIGNIKMNLINKIDINKSEVTIGEKIKLRAMSSNNELMYKYIINQGENQIHYREYSKDNATEYVTEYVGEHIITIQCKDEKSEKEFEDVKKVRIKVKLKEKYKIKSIFPMDTSLYTGNELKFKVDVEKTFRSKPVFKYEIIDKEGNVNLLNNFSEKKVVKYVENHPGVYTLICYVKAEDSIEEFEDKNLLMYSVKMSDTIDELPKEQNVIREELKENINEDTEESNIEEEIVPVEKAVAVDVDKNLVENVSIKYITINKLINNGEKGFIDLEVFADGGSHLLYSFKINKSGEEEIIDFSPIRTFRVSIEKFGKYEIQTTVKDINSQEQYDKKLITYVYIGDNKVDYTIMDAKDEFLIREKISIDFHKKNLYNTLYKYIIRFEDTKIEEIGFSKNSKLIFEPRVAGYYFIDIIEKAIETGVEKEYKNNTVLCVKECETVKITEVLTDRDKYIIDNPITVKVESQYGEDVMYEFYYKETADWKLSQSLSKKNYYTFLPTKLGVCTFFIIAKSRNSFLKYDDYKKIDLNIIK